jgi:hypothetical protein
MPRSGSSATFEAFQAALIRPVFFVSIQAADETLYLWSGLGTIAWSGHTWTGAGTLASIGTIEEGSNVEARGLQLGLSGVPSSILNEVLLNLRIAMPGTIYLGAFNEDGSLIADPVTSFVGYVDKPEIVDGGDTCNITISLEDVLVDLNRSVWRRYTNDDQTRDYPTDEGMSFVTGIQEITTYWGIVPNFNNQ